MFVWLVIVSFFTTNVEVYSANIVGYFPTRSISHHMTFQAIYKALSLKGHKVTVITPFPILDPALTNLTEIYLKFDEAQWPNISKGLSASNSMISRVKFAHYVCGDRNRDQLEDKQFQKLMSSGREFDVALVQTFCPIAFVLPAKFRIPTVAISSMRVFLQTHDSIGNPTHPLLVKDIFFYYQGQPNLYIKVSSILYNIWYRLLYYWYIMPQVDKLAREYFGNDIPYLGDVEKNVSLVLVNENPLMNVVKPKMPNYIDIGQVHIRPKKPLPKDLQEYLDKSTEGLVYFSLGSNVKSANLSETLRNTIIKALSELPYNVLWKWETDSLPGKPKNVVINKWLPQQDVLGHKNVKVFFTQGGFQSIEEAINNEMPMVAMPFMSDQPENVKRLVELGMAIKIDHKTVTKDQLRDAILEVAQNKKYKEQVQKSKALLEDQPIKGVDKAVWWIEYVIRHKGAAHLRSPSADMSFFEYFMIDAVAVIVGVLVIIIVIFYYVLKMLLHLLSCRRRAKVKTS